MCDESRLYIPFIDKGGEAGGTGGQLLMLTCDVFRAGAVGPGFAFVSRVAGVERLPVFYHLGHKGTGWQRVACGAHSLKP